MKPHLALAAMLAALFFTFPARAAVTVFGDGPERACYVVAKSGVDTLNGMSFCNAALANGLNNHDRAATFVNRGVIEHKLGRLDDAMRDFDDCLQIDPQQPDAFLNRGVALISLKRYGDALTDIEKGIALGTSEPAIGYYDRAIAEEELGRLTEAYHDYQRAVATDPHFVAAGEALARFQVITGPAPRS